MIATSKQDTQNQIRPVLKFPCSDKELGLRHKSIFISLFGIQNRKTNLNGIKEAQKILKVVLKIMISRSDFKHKNVSKKKKKGIGMVFYINIAIVSIHRMFWHCNSVVTT